MQGANISMIGEDSKVLEKNFKDRQSFLSHCEFKDKFFKVNETKKNKIAPLLNKKQTKNSKGISFSTLVSQNEDWRQTHSKLFQRASVKTPKKIIKKHEGKTLFALMQEDFTDPFENAKETKLIFGQIQITNKAMFVLGFFGFLINSVAYE